MNGCAKGHGRRLLPLGVLIFFLLSTLAHALPTGLQEFYVLGYEPHVYAVLNDVDQKNPVDSFEHGLMSSVISFTVAADNQVVVFDHWENGYEADILRPVQLSAGDAARTQIWGDGDPSNGIAPGDDGDDILVAGQPVVLRSDRNDATINGYVPVGVAAPHRRNPAEVRYDGGDRLVTAGGAINVVHASWPRADTYIGGSFEVPAVELYRRKYSYTVPVGVGSFVDFAYVYLMVQATADNTSVIVNNGTDTPLEVILNQGESLLVSDDADASYRQDGQIATLPAGITRGTVVSASAPVQAGIITGAPGRYQTRYFLLLPDPLFSPDYHVPYPSQPGADSEIYLFNPNPDPITVTAWDNLGSFPIAIAAGGAVSYSGTSPGGRHVPYNSGVRLSSDDVFWGVGSGDSGDTTNDWGYSLIPDLFVRNDVTTSWSPGTIDLSADGSPIWVTPLADDTTFWVDVDGDGIADDVDIDGDDAPESGPYTIDALQSLRFHDWVDDDNSGMHIWADNPFTALWGPDPSVSPASTPGIDWGNSILPPDRNFLNPSLDLETVAEPTRVDPAGGTVHKTLSLSCGPVGPVTDVDLSDFLPGEGWSYVSNSAVLRYPDGYEVQLEPELFDGGQELRWNISNTVGAFETLEIGFDMAFTPPTGHSFVAEDWEAGQRYDRGTENVAGDWVGSWQEINDDGNPASGTVRVVAASARSGAWGMELRGGADASIWRELDLSSFTQPVLEFWFRANAAMDDDDDVWVQVSDNGGGSWTDLINFDEWNRTLLDDDVFRRWRFDLSNWSAANSRIRFAHSISWATESFDMDDLRVFDARAIWDDFEGSRAYTNGRGWAGPWIETGDDSSPTGGTITVQNTDDENSSNYLLRFARNAVSVDTIERQADLSAFTAPVLSFHWKAEALENEDVVEVLLSGDGGTSWTSVQTFGAWNSGGSPDDDRWRLVELDVSAYRSSSFRVRFRHNLDDNGDLFWVDNLWIVEDRLGNASRQVYTNTGRATGSYQGYPLISQDSARVVTGHVDISKTVSAATTEVGGILDYEIVVCNVGSQAAHGVRVTDLVPPNTTFLSATGDTGVTAQYRGESNTVTWTWAAPMAAGASVNLHMQVRVKRVPFDPTSVKNRARVHYDEGAYNETNPAETLVRIPVLDVTAFGPGTATAGSDLDYRIRLENVGSAAATHAQIRTAIPVGSEYVVGSASGSPEFSNDPAGLVWGYSVDTSGPTDPDVTFIRWSGLTLVPGGTEEPFFSARHVDTPAPGVARVYEWVTIASDQTIPARSNVVVTVISPLLLEKSANRRVVGPGFLVDYDLRVRAVGSTETNVWLSEPIPQGSWYQPGTATTGPADFLQYSTDLGRSWQNADPTLPIVPDQPVYVTNLRWFWASLPDGSDHGLSFQTRVNNPLLAATILNNQARIQSDARGPLLSNLVRIPTVDLTLTHTASRDAAQVGDRIDYRLYFGNQGSSLATSTIVTATLPEHTTLVPGTITGAPYVVTGRTIEWTLGDLPAPTSPTELAFAVTVDGGTPEGTRIDSMGWVFNGIDKQPSNTVSVLVASSNVILGLDGVRYGDQSQTMYYPLTVTNTGTAPDTFQFVLAPDSWPSANVRLFRDVDGDRSYDPGLDVPVGTTEPLPPGGELRMVVAITIPTTATDGDVHSTFVTARSLGSPGVASSVELVTHVLMVTHVSLKDFRARRVPGGVRLDWETSSEVQAAGFRLHRVLEDSGLRELLAGVFVPAEGDPLHGASYGRVDGSPEAVRATAYWLEELDQLGRSRFYGPVSVDGASLTDARSEGHSASEASEDGASLPSIRAGGLDGVFVVEEGLDFLVVDCIMPGLQFLPRHLDEGDFVEPRIPGIFHGRLDRIGWPALPQLGALLPCFGRQARSVELVEVESETVTAGGEVLPVPSLREGEGGLAALHLPSPEARAHSGLYPESCVELVTAGDLRDRLHLRFRPLQQENGGRILRFHRRIRCRVSLAPAVAQPSSRSALSLALTAGSVLRISTTSRAWIRIDRTALLGAGIDPSLVDPRRLRLRRAGIELPLEVVGEGDGRFDEGDSLAFFASGHEDVYDDHDVYFLDWGTAETPLRIASRPSAASAPTPLGWYRESRVIDPDAFYWGAVPGADDRNRWYDGRRFDSLSGPVTLTVDLDELAPEALEAATLWFEFQPMTSREAVDPDHRLRLTLGGSVVAEATWDGLDPGFVGGPIELGDLVEGENVVTAELLLAGGVPYDRVLLDRSFLSYPRHFRPRDGRLAFEVPAGSHALAVGPFDSSSIRVLDVTSETAPLAVTGGIVSGAAGSCSVAFLSESTEVRSFLVVDEGEGLAPTELEVVTLEGWSSSPPAADLVILCDARFEEGLAPLVARREAQGLRVLVTTPRKLYDEFGHGFASPEKLKEALARIWAAGGETPLRYLLLVGDASFDYKDNRGVGLRPLVPTYMTYALHLGEAASDAYYADLDDDGMPDVAVGRWPLRSVEALQTMVSRVLAYETASHGNCDWQRRLLALSGGGEPLFSVMSHEALGLAPSGVMTEAVDRNDFVTVAEARPAVRSAFDGGSLVLHYVGHGQVDQWDNEDLLLPETIEGLGNGNRAPVVISATCLDGYFTDTGDAPCRADSLLGLSSGGAIACWSSSSLASAEGKEPLLRSFYTELFHGGTGVLGDCVRQAQTAYLANGEDSESVVATHVLFGDPSMRIRVPAPDAPRDFAAEIVGASRVRLFWTAASGGPSTLAYVVERQTEAASPWSVVTTGDATMTELHVDLAPGATTAYRVRAVGAVEVFPSAPTAALTVTMPASTGIHGGGGCSQSTRRGEDCMVFPLLLLTAMLVLRSRRRKFGRGRQQWVG